MCGRLVEAISGVPFADYMREVMGEEGVMDLRELGTAIFWPMTEALFGGGASRGAGSQATHLSKNGSPTCWNPSNPLVEGWQTSCWKPDNVRVEERSA